MQAKSRMFLKNVVFYLHGDRKAFSRGMRQAICGMRWIQDI